MFIDPQKKTDQRFPSKNGILGSNEKHDGIKLIPMETPFFVLKWHFQCLELLLFSCPTQRHSS